MSRREIGEARDMASDRHAELREENLELRRWWWVHHGCRIGGPSTSELNRFGSDGEMQCGQCAIDFLRDSPEKLFIVETL